MFAWGRLQHMAQRGYVTSPASKYQSRDSRAGCQSLGQTVPFSALSAVPLRNEPGFLDGDIVGTQAGQFVLNGTAHPLAI